MDTLFNFKEEISFEGYNLLIPSVSVGNVPQLTIDLIITTLNLKKISTVWHPAIVPCVGTDPYYKTEEICTACELFVNKDLKLITMQLRSMFEPQHILSFFKEFKKALEKFKLNRIILLTSIFDYELHNIESNRFFYICDDTNSSEEFSKMQKLSKDISGTYYLNGGGFVLKLYNFLDIRQCCVIGKYVSEGDNRLDACSLLTKLLPVVGISGDVSKFVYPTSWKYVFGGPPPPGIY